MIRLGAITYICVLRPAASNCRVTCTHHMAQRRAQAKGREGRANSIGEREGRQIQRLLTIKIELEGGVGRRMHDLAQLFLEFESRQGEAVAGSGREVGFTDC